MKINWSQMLRITAIIVAISGITYSCVPPNGGIKNKEYTLTRVTTSPEDVRIYMLESSDCRCIVARVAISEDGKSVSITNAR